MIAVTLFFGPLVLACLLGLLHLRGHVADLERRLAASEPARLEALDRALEERLAAASDPRPEIALARVRRTLDPQEAEAVWPPGTRFRDGHGRTWRVVADGRGRRRKAKRRNGPSGLSRVAQSPGSTSA